MNILQFKEQLEKYYDIFPKEMDYHAKVYRVEQLAYKYIEDNFCHQVKSPSLYEIRTIVNIFIDFIDEKRRIGEAEFNAKMGWVK